MSQHAREHPELYEEAEELARELSWGRCSEWSGGKRCELDAPHPREAHLDEQGGRW